MLYGMRAIFDYLIVLAVLIILMLIAMVHSIGALPFIHFLPATAIYYWSLMRADFLFSSHVFLIGCLQDLLTNAPIGLHACIYLTIRMVAFNQYWIFLRRSFLILWASFSALMAVTLILVTLFASLYYYIPLWKLPISLLFLSGSFLLLVPLMAGMNTLFARSFWR